MTLWAWIGIACAIAFVTKLGGYLVPRSWLDSPAVHDALASVTVGLLSALVVANTFANGQTLTLDARVASLVAAVTALVLRVPFLGVVVIGVAAAAVARLAGMA